MRILAALLMMAAATLALGDSFDSVELERRGDNADIIIRFNAPVQYLRHAPVDAGKTLRVFPRFTGESTFASSPNSFRLPETDMVPRFTITYPGTDDALVLDFDQPTKFSVRGGADGRSIVVTVPTLPGAKDWVLQSGAIPAPRPSVKPAPVVVAVPSSPPVPAPRPAASTTAPAPSLPTETSVELERRGENSEIIIRFNAPVQYLRHVPVDSGKTLRVFPQVTGASTLAGSPSSYRLPETDMVPRFTLTYPGADNALVLDFDQPTKFSVRGGADGRSIVVTVPTLPGAKDLALQSGAIPLVKPSVTPVPVVAAVPSSSPVPASRPAASASIAAAPASKAETAPRVAQQQSVVAPSQPPVDGAVPQTALSKEEIESRAAALMAGARQAVEAKRGIAAADRLNQVLSLPPNSQTEAAQALMGEAREYSGETTKAKAEYEQYLKTYPNGSHVARVKERLLALANTRAPTPTTSAGVGLKPPGGGSAPWLIFGGFSQYYYYGSSQIETVTPPPPGQLTFNRDTLSLVDQRSLISNFDIQGRQRDGQTDTRVVFRDSDNRNFLNSTRSYNRVNSAYFEQTNKALGYFLRVGRQTGTGAGTPGRFDGLSAGYFINPEWRVNGVVGTPVEFNSPFQRQMYGMSLDYTAPIGKPGGNIYVIEQTLEDVRDRRAVGTEIRYFDPHLTVFGTLEYELDYRKVNVAMMQANLRTDAGTNYFANLDIRRSPPLSMLTALPGQISLDPFAPTSDFRTLYIDSVNALGVDELRRQASVMTATSSLYSVGFTHPVTSRWQLGLDYRNANISETGASGILPATPGSGTSHIFSGQVLGNGILVPNDSTVGNVIVIMAPTFTGQSYSMSYGIPYAAWRMDAIMRYYTQSDKQDQEQTRLSPTLKISYRWKSRMTFEAETGMEDFRETGPLRETSSRRYYIFGGYRWDFQ